MVCCFRLAGNTNWRPIRSGLKYMARAGYDPREALAFWRRMMETKNGQQPAELMSTHPADSTRISQLENLMPGALEEYQKAIAGH